MTTLKDLNEWDCPLNAPRQAEYHQVVPESETLLFCTLSCLFAAFTANWASGTSFTVASNCSRTLDGYSIWVEVAILTPVVSDNDPARRSANGPSL